MSEAEIYKLAIETFGPDNQIRKLHEELGELMVAMSKIRECSGYNEWEKARDNISEELADVHIMLRQMAMLYCVEEKVKAWKLVKLNLLGERLHTMLIGDKK